MQPSSTYTDGDGDVDYGRDGILLPGYDYGGGGDSRKNNNGSSSNISNNSRNANAITPFHIDSNFSIDDGNEDEDEDENDECGNESQSESRFGQRVSRTGRTTSRSLHRRTPKPNRD